MTSALETMAKVAYEAENGFGSWDLVSEKSQPKLMNFMRAALLALAEADDAQIEDVIEKAGHNDWMFANCKEFKVICRALAEEKPCPSE